MSRNGDRFDLKSPAAAYRRSGSARSMSRPNNAVHAPGRARPRRRAAVTRTLSEVLRHALAMMFVVGCGREHDTAPATSGSNAVSYLAGAEPQRVTFASGSLELGGYL